MNVLFVSRGNDADECNPIVKSQGDSLQKAGVDLDYFLILGKGMAAYVKSMIRLNRHCRSRQVDLIHAHYALSGFAASFACRKPVIVSLMGSDVFRNGLARTVIRFFNKWRWSALIVKSEEMKKAMGIDAALVIPNGVDIDQFRPIPKNEARARVHFNEKKHVVFIGDPRRSEKNFPLAEAALALLGSDGIELHVLSREAHDMLPFFMNAADVLLLTSIYEGSANVIKEAMACNCPIVATAVGDCQLVMGDTEGCFLTSFAAEDVAAKVKLALGLRKRTNGRARLLALALDQGTIAGRITRVYAQALKPEANRR